MSTTHVKGLAELQAFLDQLPAKMEANIMRAAMNAGAKVVLDEVKASAPVKTGLLKAGFSNRKNRKAISSGIRKGVVMVSIKARGKHGYLAKWIEYGTAAHFIKPKRAKSLFFAGLMRDGVDHPGARPKPFMRPALDTKAQEALLAVGEAIKKRLTKQGLDASGVDLEAQP